MPVTEIGWRGRRGEYNKITVVVVEEREVDSQSARGEKEGGERKKEVEIDRERSFG